MIPLPFLPPRRVRKQTLSVLFSLSFLLQLFLFAACSSSEESAKETASAETKVDDGTNATDNTSSYKCVTTNQNSCTAIFGESIFLDAYFTDSK